MKNLYICGDSFGCPDLDWNFMPWPKILQDLLASEWIVHNLSLCCSSNYLISLQIDKAIQSQADYIIMLATSCTRFHGRVKDNKYHNNLLDRFRRIGQNDAAIDSRDLSCYSLHSLDETCVFNHSTQDLIHQYHKNMFDLDAEIYHNQIIIERNLFRLEKSQINFIFEQGGFENPSFYVKDKPRKYFEDFDRYRSEIDQWKMARDFEHSSPHKHIIDQKTHDYIANYYATKIRQI
jgi:hypothetical protein